MQAHRLETVVQEDATLNLKDLPFKSGDRVEVIILARPTDPRQERWQSLRGSILRYDDPTEPVDEDDWEALR